MLFAQVIFLAVFWSMLMKYFWGKDNSASPPEKMAHTTMDLWVSFLTCWCAVKKLLTHSQVHIST